MNLPLLLEMAVSFDESRVAVTAPDGRSLTTKELADAAERAAALFSSTDQSRVGFCDTNGLAFPISLFGAAIARRPFVPLNYRLADGQLGAIVDRTFGVVAAADYGQRLEQLGAGHVFDADALVAETSSPPPVAESPDGSPDDVALMIYTSGTTAQPKAALLRHRHLASYIIGTVEFGSAAPDEAALLSIPPYHIAGVMNLLSNLYMGRRVVYLDAFDPIRWLETVRRQSVTHAMVVPTMLARVNAALNGTVADTPSLRTIAYGGAKMPASVITQALELFPDVAFTNGYGLTETSSSISILGPEAHRQALHSTDPAIRARLGSAGRPLPDIQIEVRDEHGRQSAPRHTGDIFVRGAQVAGEYLGSGDSADGWFATRDRGYFDEEGFLFIEGRADDTIIRGGENIAPAEIEAVLLEHDAVRDCAVVGIDDEEWGHRIAAAIVLVVGSTSSPAEIQAFVRGRLRGSKTPDLIVVMDELPYTDTGKLLRRNVREELARVARLAPLG